MQPTIIVLLFIIVLVFGLLKIKATRHYMVRLLWKVIDKLADIQAAKAELPDGIEVKLDIPYVNMPNEKQHLDVYYPENANNQYPIVIYIHGGGFVSGDKSHTKQYCMTLAKEGYTVFSLNYRLAPQFTNPVQIADIMMAISWIEKNCAEYCGDGENIVIAGDSAGAYLAGLTASICTNLDLQAKLSFVSPITAKKLKGVVLFSGLFDLESGSARRFPGIKSDIEMLLGTNKIKDHQNIESYSVIKNIRGNFPPVFISSGEVDGLHPETIGLIDSLEKQRIHYKALLFDRTEKKAFHSYQQHLHLHTSKECMERVKEFLRSITSKASLTE